ncbi:unnamed protein product [Pedinophyceae sp. YPF-701]|nr:unnamed protein product [Pedinophyceae sp. YPF-701]
MVSARWSVALALACVLALFLTAAATFENLDIPTDPEVTDCICSWSGIKDRSFYDVEAMILRDCPKVRVIEVPQNSMVTMDYSLSRVRVFVDDASRSVFDNARCG